MAYDMCISRMCYKNFRNPYLYVLSVWRLWLIDLFPFLRFFKCFELLMALTTCMDPKTQAD